MIIVFVVLLSVGFSYWLIYSSSSEVSETEVMQIAGEQNYISTEPVHNLTPEEEAQKKLIADSFPKGDQLYRQTIEGILSRVDKNGGVATELELSSLGGAYDSLGDTQKAIDYYQQARDATNDDATKAVYDKIINRISTSNE